MFSTDESNSFSTDKEVLYGSATPSVWCRACSMDQSHHQFRCAVQNYQTDQRIVGGCTYLKELYFTDNPTVA